MELQPSRLTPPPPPKSVLLPKERPNVDGFETNLDANATKDHNDPWRQSYALVSLLNESKDPTRKIEPSDKNSAAAATKEPIVAIVALKSSANLRFPWFFWTLSLLFIALALGLFYWVPKLQNANASGAIKRGLEKNASFPDPSSPTTEALEMGDPTPDLKPPTKPSRD
jgi:hypothetical protein